MIALDTNVLVRLLVQDDTDQARKARRLVEACLDGAEPCLITVPVLCELEWVLESVYGASRAHVASAVKTLMTTPPFEFEDGNLVDAALEAYSRGRGDLSDYLIGRVARSQGARTTYTFDRGLRRAGGFSLL